MKKLFDNTVRALALISLVVIPMFSTPPANAVASNLTITGMGWNVVGLDSNNVNAGPNNFPIGSKICNTSGSAITGVDITFNWADATATYIYEETGESLTRTYDIPANSCQQAWWTILVNRNAASYDKTRAYTISASATGQTTVTTTSRTLTVEHLVSQNRNTVTSVVFKNAAGSATITSASPGDTIQIIFTGATSTSYPMVTAWPAFDSRLLNIQGITMTYGTTYRTPVTPSPVADLMANGCDWDFAAYACLSDGKAGGNITTTLTAKIPLGVNATATFSGMIYDFSGSSYHYNSDYAVNASLTIGTPTAAVSNDSYSTTVGATLTGNVSTNDTKYAGTNTFTKTSNPSCGTVVFNADGTFTYDTTGCTAGTKTFDYTMCDASTPQNCLPATVSIVISAAAVNVVATDDTYTMNYQTALPGTDNVKTNDTLPGVATYTVTHPAPGGTPSHSKGSTFSLSTAGVIAYTPADGFSGVDTFQYQVCDNASPANCDTAVVNLVVGPNAVNDSNSTAMDTAVNGNTSSNDTYQAGSAFTKLTNPSHGTVTFNSDGTYTYTPTTSYTGTDSFTYKVCLPAPNGTVCSTATVNLVVGPVAVDDSGSTNFNSALSGNLGTNDTKPAGSTFALDTNPSHGTVVVNTDGTYTYTPTTGYSGTDTFTYKLCLAAPNDTVCSTATVTLAVGPNAVNDTNTTNKNTAVNGNVSTNDTYQAGSTFTKLTNPSNGTVTFNADGTYSYDPANGYTGTDSFTYKVCLPAPNATLCSTATVTITISGPRGGGGGGSTPPTTPPTTPPGNNNNPGRFTPTTPGNTNVILPPPPPGGTTQILVNGNPVCTTTTGTCGVPALLGPKAKIEAIITNPDGTKVTEILPAYKPEKPIPALVVYFPLASYKLTAPEIKKLNNFIKLVKEQGFTKLVLSGHTDVQGTVTGYDNVKLSNNRSKVVNAYLKKYLTVVTTQSHHADTQPAVEGSGETVYKNNRRTQVAVW